MIRFSLVSLILINSAFAFDWQGHRGARGLYPENTIGAMEEALKYPVTTLELDVVVSKDMKVVVSHEPWMSEEFCQNPEGKRVKGRENNLYKMTYEEIQRFDCGSIPHPRFPQQKKVREGKPLLDRLLTESEQMLRKLNREKLQYNIEIKSTVEDERDGFQPDYKTFTDLVVKTIQAQLKNDKFVLQSFDWRVLRYLHEKYPDIQLSALIETEVNPQENLKTLGFNPQIFSPDFTLLKKEHVAAFHALNIKVIPWTVNTVPEMEKLIGMNVDGIITDYPNLISSVAVKKCGAKSHLFEGKCVKMPTHSVPSELNPGWKCKDGFVQKRSKCEKIKLPAHSVLLEDGKTWECKTGYERYRGTCKKITQ